MTSDRQISPIGAAILRLRRERGLTQEELAKAAGLNRSAIAKIETGQRKSPGTDTLLGIARALGVTLEELTAGEAASEHPALTAFLASPWAQALATDGEPVTPGERAVLLRIIGATWVEGSPTPRTLYKILQAIRDERAK